MHLISYDAFEVEHSLSPEDVYSEHEKVEHGGQTSGSAGEAPLEPLSETVHAAVPTVHIVWF